MLITFTTGVGLTVIVKLCDKPEHPLLTGATVMVATCGVAVLLTEVNEGIVPVPLAARPILVLSLTQLYVVPLNAPVKVTVVVGVLLQTT